MSNFLDWRALNEWSPAPSLRRAADAKWLVDGVIPAGGITWLVASPESFKTFVALDLAAAVARGGSWHGRPSKRATALFVAAEGGENIHVRRAAADLAAGVQPGPLAVVQLRPRLDEPSGLHSLQALLYRATGGSNLGLAFQAPALHDSFAHQLSLLSDDERAEYDRRLSTEDAFDDYAFVDEAAAKHWSVSDRAIEAAFCALSDAGPRDLPRDRVFLVIDTYSQTSGDDTKATVSRYIKTLRDLQDEARRLKCEVTVLVIDHTTKAGDTYMGSGAKEGDPDAMLELDRHGDSFGATLKCTKMKDAPHFAPVHLELKQVEIPGYPDEQGRPLVSLAVADGARAHRLRRAVGANGDSAAATLLGAVEDSGPLPIEQLRQVFNGLPANAQKTADAKRMAFKRALDVLQECGAVVLADDLVSLSQERSA